MKKAETLIIVLIMTVLLAACGTDWKISNGTLIEYTGSETEVTVPEDVTALGSDCFAGDFDRGVNLTKVTVPGSVNKIDSRAFAFTNADTIVIEEGVEILGDSIFMDAYIKEVHFPKSVKKCGSAVMETEEGLDGTKIYIKKGSYMDGYFKKNMPYGQVEIIYEQEIK